jgi:hypothetical protein
MRPSITAAAHPRKPVSIPVREGPAADRPAWARATANLAVIPVRRVTVNLEAILVTLIPAMVLRVTAIRAMALRVTAPQAMAIPVTLIRVMAIQAMGSAAVNSDWLQGMSAYLPARHRDQFLMGLVLGAGAAWVLSDEALRAKMIKAGMKLYANIAGGFEELKKQMADIRAEVAEERHGDE